MLHKSTLLLAVIIGICSCKKSGSDIPAPHPPGDTLTEYPGINEPGYGKSKEPFKDAPWKLPNGISLTTNVHWFDYCNTDTNWVNKKKYVGVPNTMLELFVVCMEFRNNTDQAIIFRLPGSVAIQSRYERTQNGFIITNHQLIIIPARDVIRIFASVYCVNHDRHAPFDTVNFTNEFTLGPDKLPAALQEIVDIIEPKNLTYEKILNPNGSVDDNKAFQLKVIQEAIWQVTDSAGLENETRQRLRDINL